jgi:hypothetical protein
VGAGAAGIQAAAGVKGACSQRIDIAKIHIAGAADLDLAGFAPLP